MVKIITAGLASIALLLTATAVNVQAAAPQWDVTGNWDIHLEYLGSHYVHDVTLTQDNDGDLDGTGSYDAGGYEWDITSGSVSGDTIQFSAQYTSGSDATNPLTTMIVTGTIATSGTMSGTWSDNYQGGVRTGTWTSSGEVAESLNYAPVLTGVPSSATTIPELSLYSFNADASDADGDGLTFSLMGAPTGASINSTTGVFTWTPTESQGEGHYTFSVRVSDGTATDTETVVLQVSEVTDSNDVPTLTNVPSSATIPELSLYTFNANVSDSDDDTHTFSLVGAPSGASINSTTGVFTWTPTESQGSGDYTFSVRVSDGTATDTESVTLHVTEVGSDNDNGNGDPHHGDKDQCKKGGWKSFTSPSFKNQGQCIKHMNHK